MTAAKHAAKAPTPAPGKPRTPKRVKKFRVGVAVKKHGYRVMQQTSTGVIVAVIREGIPTSFLKQMATDMAVPQERIYEALGLPRATIGRKAKEGKLMSPGETERALALARLIGQAEEIVERSGNPEGFDAARWVAAWLLQPNPALEGKRPAEWMDTALGRELVSDTLARLESGAYA